MWTKNRGKECLKGNNAKRCLRSSESPIVSRVVQRIADPLWNRLQFFVLIAQEFGQKSIESLFLDCGSQPAHQVQMMVQVVDGDQVAGHGLLSNGRVKEGTAVATCACLTWTARVNWPQVCLEACLVESQFALVSGNCRSKPDSESMKLYSRFSMANLPGCSRWVHTVEHVSAQCGRHHKVHWPANAHHIAGQMGRNQFTASGHHSPEGVFCLSTA